MRLIDAETLCGKFKRLTVSARNWKERAIMEKNEEAIIRADATLAFLSEVKLTIDNAPTEESYKEKYDNLKEAYKLLLEAYEYEATKGERPQGGVVYLCDGNNCPAEKASCNNGGPCRHTTNIEHAINFRRFHDTDAFYEVENVMRIEGQEDE